jgi:hypothetical protein
MVGTCDYNGSKGIFESKPEVRRKTGQPRLRWRESVENYLMELKKKKKRNNSSNGEEWISL